MCHVKRLLDVFCESFSLHSLSASKVKISSLFKEEEKNSEESPLVPTGQFQKENWNVYDFAYAYNSTDTAPSGEWKQVEPINKRKYKRDD